jgi:hypothetical protein
MQLDDAAEKLPIKKKTLDDYYIQLQTAYLTDFNFDNLRNITMSEIRSHNKVYELDEKTKKILKEKRKMKKLTKEDAKKRRKKSSK